ncbi:unnamed protein product [Plutella xylostella]|uniref:(diamondback moth) hypothetical protein n=2 Tax=Plutella xylostella TaxID=51655 RepID=A0A8S4FTR0_PLUXY|nr:unnamed protein product [Plutella xylostella]CAG9099791.1 unnamed protein product [Plutella xylostella]CAG9119993.1 unnamed protein product [Plutella xylostella]CAG9130059.1 unnamed protein product [Plutella xylostella]CAG9134854.1 unnamed protein product [Plutella xylostella]
MSKRGRTIQSQSRELIVKLHDYFERESLNGGPLVPVAQVHDRIIDALGIGTKTIRKVLKEKYGPSGSEDNVLRTPKKRKKSKPVTGIDSFDADAIRNHIYGYYSRKEYPTVSKLLVSLKEAGLFTGSATSLVTVMKQIGFEYKKSDQRKIIMERYDLVKLRVSFLRKMNKITDWDNVVFIDETWLNSNHTVPQSWTDDTKASCSNVPMGKGGRLIICHAGSAGGGFVDNALLAFESKSTKEYHEEMDAVKFKEWFATSLLPNLPHKSIIIMDNAPYHSIHIDKPPTQANKKADIVAWLERHGIEADLNSLKAELLQLVRENKPTTPRYEIDELAQEHGHTVIRTPPYHCQYNAIELIWAQVKGYAARKNTERPFSTKKMMGLLKEACAKITKEDWAKVVQRTKNLIKADFDRDINIDNMIDNEIIIYTGDDSSTDYASDESE